MSSLAKIVVACGLALSGGAVAILLSGTSGSAAQFAYTNVSARVQSLSATRTKAGVVVRWRTASEIQALGFHVFRQTATRRVRIDRTLIAARGRASYSFLDRRAPHARAVRYWLQWVSRDGGRSWYGPVLATPR